MIDISKQTVELECPECNRTIKVTLKQVAEEVKVTCYCRQSIQLKDDNGSAKKSIKEINKSFNDLEKAFKNLGK